MLTAHESKRSSFHRQVFIVDSSKQREGAVRLFSHAVHFKSHFSVKRAITIRKGFSSSSLKLLIIIKIIINSVMIIVKLDESTRENEREKKFRTTTDLVTTWRIELQ